MNCKICSPVDQQTGKASICWSCFQAVGSLKSVKPSDYGQLKRVACPDCTEGKRLCGGGKVNLTCYHCKGRGFILTEKNPLELLAEQAP